MTSLRPPDPRPWQIAALSSLLAFGILALDFGVAPSHAAAAIAGALGAEAVGRAIRGERFSPLSPLITALSLTLLLRASSAELMLLAGAAAVGSKFIIRAGGRHIFNPANFALVGLTLAAAPLGLGAAWISPGQWGALGLAAVVVAGAGAMVAGRAARLDTTLSFLGVWSALTFGRAFWFGDPLAIPLNQLQSGALLVFAFFMISDPATTPTRRWARLLHAGAVAGLGFWLQTAWVSDVGPVHALFMLAPALVLLNWPAARARHFADEEKSPWPLRRSEPAPSRSAPASPR